MSASKEQNIFSFFQFRILFGISQGPQIVLITILYMTMTLGYYFSIKATGKMDGYAPGVSLLFVPIYEELIFRGLILKYFESIYGFWKGVFFSSILFGVWHFKNLFWLEPNALLHQILYTGLFFGPICAWVTLKTRSVWPAVILHYLNNMPYEHLIGFLGK